MKHHILVITTQARVVKVEAETLNEAIEKVSGEKGEVMEDSLKNIKMYPLEGGENHYVVPNDLRQWR